MLTALQYCSTLLLCTILTPLQHSRTLLPYMHSAVAVPLAHSLEDVFEAAPTKTVSVLCLDWVPQQQFAVAAPHAVLDHVLRHWLSIVARHRAPSLCLCVKQPCLPPSLPSPLVNSEQTKAPQPRSIAKPAGKAQWSSHWQAIYNTNIRSIY